MRIAHVLSSLRVGGQERLVLDLARVQKAAGHEVIVVSLAREEGVLESELGAAGVEVARIGKRDGLDATLPPRLFRFFRGRHVDVVHTHNRLPLVYAAPPGRVAGARVVHTRHGPGTGTPKERVLRRAATRFVHAYVAVSPETAETARATRDCPDDKLRVVANGVDPQAFKPDPDLGRRTRAALGWPEDAWVAITVGRMAPEKTYDVLLRAMRTIVGPKRRLALVGDGPERARWEAASREAGLGEHVHFLGARRDVPALLAAADAFVLSSRMEGLPLVLLEAMACELPVVSTAVGGIPGVLRDGVTGFLVAPGDEAALGARLRELADDPPRGRAMGAAGRQDVLARYSLAAMAAGYQALYEGRRM